MKKGFQAECDRLCGRADRIEEWGWACWFAAALPRRPELADVLSCNTITWVSDLKPWREALATKFSGSRAAKLRRLEQQQTLLDIQLGAVDCGQGDRDPPFRPDVRLLPHSPEVQDQDYEAEDERLDEMGTQPFVCDDSTGHVEQDNVDKDAGQHEDIEEVEEADTIASPQVAPASASRSKHRVSPSGSELWKRIKSICEAGDHNTLTMADISRKLSREFGR